MVFFGLDSGEDFRGGKAFYSMAILSFLCFFGLKCVFFFPSHYFFFYPFFQIISLFLFFIFLFMRVIFIDYRIKQGKG